MSDQPLNVGGKSELRRDGLSHVTGKTQYVDDIQFPDMLYLKMVRSPLHHARILGIDFSEAEKVPGFVRAFTYKDVPKNLYIIGTMNTADRSVEALDTALRRRFTFEEMRPEPGKIEQPDNLQVDLRKLFEVINARPCRQRGYVVGRAVSDPYWEYVRTLDSSEGLCGKKG